MSEMERHYPHVPKARIIELALKELEKKLQFEERLSAEPVQASCVVAAKRRERGPVRCGKSASCQP